MTTVVESANVPTIGRIPIKNIWLLMLYASELYRELPRARSVDVEDDPDDLPNLVAEILTHAVERRMRRNLSFDYRRRRADLDRVRGRIDILRTERRQLLQRGRVACTFEELTVDTPRNRFVRAALDLLGRLASDMELAHRCRAQSAKMERAGVIGDIRRTTVTAHERFGRLGAEDRQMMSAARLAFDLALPTEDTGAFHLATPEKEEHWVRRLFERAVGGFYEVALSPKGWRIHRGRWFRWPVDAKSPGIDAVLPSMQTDIELERPNSVNTEGIPRRIVIDTKFTSIIAPGRHDNQRLDSKHIYQIYAYLRSQEGDADPASLDAAGVLLHPSVGERFDESAVIQGHEIRFATVDLAADGSYIRSQLLRIAETGQFDSRYSDRSNLN